VDDIMVLDLTKKVQLVTTTLEKKKVIIPEVLGDIVIDVDISGSMQGRFGNGTVQELITRLLAIGMVLDQNKSIDVFAFNSGSHEVGSATEKNIDGFVDNVFLRKVKVRGGTDYSPAMKDIVSKFGNKKESKSALTKLFGKRTEPRVHPTIVFFVTDGELSYSDMEETKRVLRATSDQPIFWQFVGIGGESSFDFLKSLDTLDGRVVDNANFFEVEGDLRTLSDEWFYDKILNEFPSWLTEIKTKGLL
jgi:hypothetical protein